MHIYGCAKKHKIDFSNIENKYQLLIFNYNFDELKSKEQLELFYDVSSLPDFTKKFGINYPNTYFLLDYYNIKKRTISEGCTQIAQKKIQQTCLQKYGTTNVLSKGTKIYDTRNNTVKKKYGVDNVFQIKEIIEKCNTKDAHAKTAIGWKKWYYNLTSDEKETFLHNSIHSEQAKENTQKRPGYKVSGLELKICEFLDLLDITYTRQFKIKKPKEQQGKYNNKFYFYDIYLNDYNIILEINGDYWHANPQKYQANDIISYIYGAKTAQDIWNRDKIKNDYAINNGYKLIIIWENEIREKQMLMKTDDEIKTVILNKLKQHEKY
jgi:G:T-mismatch repair DNA endonuclease (very short patch repair protein)